MHIPLYLYPDLALVNTYMYMISLHGETHYIYITLNIWSFYEALTEPILPFLSLLIPFIFKWFLSTLDIISWNV